jgi:hypothetical protein
MQPNILVVVEKLHSERALVRFGTAVLIILCKCPISIDVMRLMLTNVQGYVLPPNHSDRPKWPLSEFAEIDLARLGGDMVPALLLFCRG